MSKKMMLLALAVACAAVFALPATASATNCAYQCDDEFQCWWSWWNPYIN